MKSFEIDEDEFIEPDYNEEDAEYLYQIDDDKDEELVHKIKSLSGIKSKRQRTEVVSDELHVNLGSAEGNKNKVRTHELLSSLKTISNLGSLKKILTKAHKRTKVLGTPLSKNITDKAHRITAYVGAKKEASTWEPIVQRNRKAEQLEFPLKQPNLSMMNASTFVKTWKAETDLEKEISELLKSSENNLTDQKLLTPAELKGIQMMSIEELKEKRAEFMKLKALQHYQEAKFKRIKKIKSKRYRKVLRKEKLKNEKNDLDKLEKENPSEFNQKLADMEKNRMQERMSLRHKNTSQWAKRQTIYGKYNDKAREEVHDQLGLAKQLTQKLQQNDFHIKIDNEEEKPTTNEVNIDAKKLLAAESKNPWISFVSFVEEENAKDEADGEYAFSRPKAFVDRYEIENAKRQIEEADSDSDDDSPLEIERERENIFNSDSDDEPVEEIKGAKAEDRDKENVEEAQKSDNKSKKKKLDTKNESPKEELEKEENKVKVKDDKPENEVKEYKKIDPSKILIAKFDNETNDYEDDILECSKKIDAQNKAKKHLLTISEAFEDDDVVREFRLDKKRVVDEEKVKSIDLSLPGWGDWTGAGIDPNEAKKSKRKRRGKRKLVIQLAPNEQLRRDKELDNVIISEKKDEKIASFQINELPRQFNNVEDFEKKISQPIGRTWNPETKYRKLTQPRVVSRIGAVIDPIEKDDVILSKKNIKNYKRK